MGLEFVDGDIVPTAFIEEQFTQVPCALEGRGDEEFYRAVQMPGNELDERHDADVPPLTGLIAIEVSDDVVALGDAVIGPRHALGNGIVIVGIESVFHDIGGLLKADMLTVVFPILGKEDAGIDFFVDELEELAAFVLVDEVDIGNDFETALSLRNLEDVIDEGGDDGKVVIDNDDIEISALPDELDNMGLTESMTGGLLHLDDIDDFDGGGKFAFLGVLGVADEPLKAPNSDGEVFIGGKFTHELIDDFAVAIALLWMGSTKKNLLGCFDCRHYNYYCP